MAKAARYVERLKAAGYMCAEAKAAGYMLCAEVKAAGYTSRDVKAGHGRLAWTGSGGFQRSWLL